MTGSPANPTTPLTTTSASSASDGERLGARTHLTLGHGGTQRRLVRDVRDRDDLRAHRARLLDQPVDRRGRSQRDDLEPLTLGAR